MSDIAFDRGGYFPSPLTEWYRERPFKLALAGSLLIHAALLAVVPGFRSVPPDMPKVLDVEILKEEPPVAQTPVRRQPLPEVKREVEPPPVEPPKPVVEPPRPVVEQPAPVVEPPRPVEQVKPEPRKVEPRPEPRIAEPEPVSQPEPLVRQPEPIAPPPPRTEVLQTAPRPEQKPEFVAPRPDPRPQPENVQPRPEVRPEPPMPRVAPQQQAPVATPRVEPVTPPPSVTPPPAVTPPPVSPQVAVQAPPPPPAPARQAEPAAERGLVMTYEKSLSDLIKRQEKYPPRAKREGWQGTAVVGLSLSADGKVAEISLLESSGRDVLDQAALEMVRRASPLPRAPEGLRGKERLVRVPIVFKLQDS